MTRLRPLAFVTAAAVSLAACGTSAYVTSERADQIPAATTSSPAPTLPETDPPPSTQPDPAPDPAPDPTLDPAPDPDPDPDPTVPPSTLPPATDPEAIDFGPNKPNREYDDYLLAVVSDLNNWWAEQYPAVYGEEFVPLAGRIYAAYPNRPDDLPGCGEPRTTYEEVQEFVAFYCGIGDFMVYDDGATGLLAELARNFGAATIGIVLAHEYGHAIQLRNGALDRSLPTIITEQQADCFAGAWAARARRGEVPGIAFTERDVRAGLIAMLEVRDPVGLDQFSPGGHGSGFDRVGAFQVGFNEGPARCAELLDEPLPLSPNQFISNQDLVNEGNAPFGYGEDELIGFLTADLNLFWDVELDALVEDFDGLQLVPVQSREDVACPELTTGFETGAALCPTNDTVYLNEPAALELYRQGQTFGDFSIGYLLGIAWAEAVQRANGSPFEGEARALRNDCLAGAWVQTVIPIDFALPEPRAEGRTSSVSPGDLDEAVRTLLLIGDLSADDDIVGTPFEKIDAFRAGVIGGLDACGL